MEELKDLRIPFEFIKHATNNFDHGNFIARGGFGMVYKGEFPNSKGLTMVALKRVNRSAEQGDASFLREIMFLSRYRHENLISLIGFCDENGERIIVSEYASNRSLDIHLSNPNLTWIQRLNICLGAARGLEYLHNPKGGHTRVLHRDIKSGNILLDENWNAKIADFGLSKYGPANQQQSFLFTNVGGTHGYCDPVYQETMTLTKESDVYSFGVVLFEVLCSRLCYEMREKDDLILPFLVKRRYQEKTLDTLIDTKLRQQMDHNSYDTFVTLAYQCLERDRTQRPLMASVVKRLQAALKYQEAFELKAQEPEPGPEALLRSRKLQEVSNPLLDFEKICPPEGSNILVLYTTGDKTIQKGFEDCSSIRSLLIGFRVSYQERDVSVHLDFKHELWQILGTIVALPRLFIKGRYIGGAEEVLQLNEQGKFQPLLAGIRQNISEGESTSKIPC